MKSQRKHTRSILTGAVVGAAVMSFLTPARATIVTLQNPTATYSQTFGGGFMISNVVDGITTTGNGWAVYNLDSSSVGAQTAAFETASDLGATPGGTFTFTLVMNYANSPYSDLLGRFRLSVTTDDRSTFADGNQGTITPGDVSATWIQLTPLSVTSLNGTTFTINGDDSILATYVPYPDYQYTDTYTVQASTSLTGITGIRLEAMEDPSLPIYVLYSSGNGGPGFDNLSGNFVLTEFQVSFEEAAVPEPSTVILLGLGAALLAGPDRRRGSRR